MRVFIKNINVVISLMLLSFTLSVDALAQEADTTSKSTAVDTVVIPAPQTDHSIKISGKVKDASAGIPLVGISISVPGFSSSLTNKDGVFSIRVPDYNATLILSGDGYQQKEFPLRGKKDLEISLTEDKPNSIYDQAYMPNHIITKTAVSNSMVSLNPVSKWQSSAETPENYLQGNIAGLNIIRRSGEQGIGGNMFLRGFSSFYGTNQPLVIVDGVIYDMNDYGGSLINDFFANPLSNIDIKDIDNITVIKDAASIYGSKGANGVILITTAHAEKLATKIDFSAYGGVNIAPSNLPVMNNEDHRIYVADMLKSRGYSDSYIQSQPYMNDDPQAAGYRKYHNSTNWQKEILKNSANTNYYLKVTGGDNIAKYALSVGYLGQGGIIDKSNLTRYNTRFNADLNMSPKLTVNTNLAFTYGEQYLFDGGIANNSNPIYLSLVKSPFLSVHEISDDGFTSPKYSDADIFNISNPVPIVQNMRGTNKKYRFFGSVKFNYKLSKNLNVSSLFGLTFDKIRENIFAPRQGTIPDTLKNSLAYSRLGSQVQYSLGIYNDTHLSYGHTFNNIHNVTADLGLRYISNKSEEDYGLGYNSPTDEFKTVGRGVNELRQVGGQIGKWKWLNYYAYVNYQLRSKYSLFFAMAMDGSSRFGEKVDDKLAVNIGSANFGIFPSVGASWIVSSETFMSDLNFIELLKFRATYGITGNDDIGNYSTKQVYVSQNFLGYQGLLRGNLVNPSVQWETNKKFNVGADIALLNERVSVSIDLYKYRNDNLITYESITGLSGFDNIISNNGGMQNQGAEVAIYGRVLDKAVKWDIGLNLATYRNKITKLPYERLINHYGGAEILTQVGKAANLFYGYKTDGVFISDEEADSYGYKKELANGVTVPFKGGDIRFVDTNNDQIIDASDKQVIGNPNPDFTGMFNTNLSWKKITLNAIFTFSYGNDVYNYTRAQLESMKGYENQMNNVVNRWRIDGQVTNVPKAVWGDPMENSRFSDRWIEDGSYLRLRTLSVSYELPFKNNYIKYSNLFLSGNNLLTFTKYLGYDPEFSASSNIFYQGIDLGHVPQFKSFLVGIRIGL